MTTTYEVIFMRLEAERRERERERYRGHVCAYPFHSCRHR